MRTSLVRENHIVKLS